MIVTKRVSLTTLLSMDIFKGRTEASSILEEMIGMGFSANAYDTV